MIPFRGDATTTAFSFCAAPIRIAPCFCSSERSHHTRAYNPVPGSDQKFSTRDVSHLGKLARFDCDPKFFNFNFNLIVIYRISGFVYCSYYPPDQNTSVFHWPPLSSMYGSTHQGTVTSPPAMHFSSASETTEIHQMSRAKRTPRSWGRISEEWDPPPPSSFPREGGYLL